MLKKTRESNCPFVLLSFEDGKMMTYLYPYWSEKSKTLYCMLNISKHSGTTWRHRHKMIVVLLILLTEIHMCYCVHAYYGTCKPNEECTVLQWKEWGMCRGNCRNPITQVRKRPICADFLMVQPFTRANVKKILQHYPNYWGNSALYSMSDWYL